MNASANGWASLPLCRQYLLVLLDDIVLRTGERGCTRGQAVRWGHGVLADGQHELLGVWLDEPRAAGDWQEVADDLQSRGVERIRFVTGNAQTDAIHRRYPGAKTLPSIHHISKRIETELRAQRGEAVDVLASELYAADSMQRAREVLARLEASGGGLMRSEVTESWLEQLAPLYALPARLRRMFRIADNAVRRSHEMLSRSVARHGRFLNQEIAAAFTAKALVQAVERDLGMLRTLGSVSCARYPGRIRSAPANAAPGI